MKVRPKKIYTGDLKMLKAEYDEMGFDTHFDGKCLTVFARWAKRQKTRRQVLDEQKKLTEA